MPLKKHCVPMYLQQGVGLIEVLIAVLVLSVGILGLAAMQVNAKRLSYDAMQRSLATSMVRDIISRMRVNDAQAASYVVDDLGGGSIANEPAPNCKSADCTPTQLAAHDLWEWEQALDGAAETITTGGNTSSVGGLVTPRACITHNAGVVTVAIAWKGGSAQVNPTASACGEGNGLYGADEAERRLLVVTTYIADV